VQDSKDTGARASQHGLRKYEKLLLVLVFGAVFGALELFGRDALRVAGVEHKAAPLYGIGIIILYASKAGGPFPRLGRRHGARREPVQGRLQQFLSLPGRRGDDHAFVFDIAYSTFKSRLDSSALLRTLAAPVIVYVSYAAFAILAAFVLREERGARTDGREFVRTCLPPRRTSLISMVTIHLGYYLGNAIRPLVALRKPA